MHRPLIDLTVIQGGNVTAPHPDSVHAEPAPPAQQAQAAPPAANASQYVTPTVGAAQPAAHMVSPHPDSPHAAPKQAAAARVVGKQVAAIPPPPPPPPHAVAPTPAPLPPPPPPPPPQVYYFIWEKATDGTWHTNGHPWLYADALNFLGSNAFASTIRILPENNQP